MWMLHGDVFSRICMCGYVFVLCNGLTFESLHLESLCFWCAGTSTEFCISRSSGQGQGHKSKNARPCVLFVGGMPSIEKQSCLKGNINVVIVHSHRWGRWDLSPIISINFWLHHYAHLSPAERLPQWIIITKFMSAIMMLRKAFL